MFKRLGIASLVMMAAQVASAQYHQFDPAWGYTPKAATVGESHARGMADLVRSSGYANLQNSKAAINIAEARSREMDNRVKYAETYYERRRIRDEAKSYGKTKITQEQAYRVAAMQRPKALNQSEFNPSTGQINWPLGLMQKSMEQTRNRIDHLMAHASVTGQLSADEYFEVVRLCQALDNQLKVVIDQIPIQEASQASAFIKRLAYAARKAAT